MNLEHLRTAGQASLFPDRIKITVGMATCGLAAGSDVIFDTLKQRLQQRGLDVRLTKTGCLGCCHQEPDRRSAHAWAARRCCTPG